MAKSDNFNKGCWITYRGKRINICTNKRLGIGYKASVYHKDFYTGISSIGATKNLAIARAKKAVKGNW